MNGSAGIKYLTKITPRNWSVPFLLLCAILAAVPLNAIADSQNLLTNGGFEAWRKNQTPDEWGYKLVHPSSPDREKPRPAYLRADSNIKKEGETSLRIETASDNEIVILKSPTVDIVPGETYKISLYLRNNGAHFSIRQDLWDANGKIIRGRFKRIIDSSQSHGWRQLDALVHVEENERGLSLTLFTDKKKGEIWIDDCRIENITSNLKNNEENNKISSVHFRMTPEFYTDDNIFRLPQGSPLSIMLTVSNPRQIKHLDPNAPQRIWVDLPDGVDLLGGDYDSKQYATPVSIEIQGKPYTRYDYEMAVPDLVLRNLDFSRSAFGSVVLLVKSNLAPSDAVLPCYIRYVDGNNVSEGDVFNLKITEPLPDVRAPQKFRSSIVPGASGEYGGDLIKTVAEFYKRMGFNDVVISEYLRARPHLPGNQSRSPAFIFREITATGLSTTYSSTRLKNAYAFNAGKLKIPDECRIRRADGTIVANTFDPAYIRRRGDYFAKAFDEFLDDVIELECNRIWINWEIYPYMLEKGSFTPDSLQDFSDYIGKSIDEVQQMGPDGILKNYREKWLDFQSWQHAETLKVYVDLVQEKSRSTGVPIELMPCMSPSTVWPEAYGAGQLEQFRRMCKGQDFAPFLNAFSSWFYVRQDCYSMSSEQKKRLYELGMRESDVGDDLSPITHQKTLEAVEKITANIAKFRRKDSHKVSYVHLTQNLQVNSWVVQPDAIGLQMLAAWIGGADGVQLYYFPMGYDGRYWRSAANANDCIAFYEDFRQDATPVNDEFTLVSRLESASDSEYRNNLVMRVFAKGGKRLIVLFNFDFLQTQIFDLICNDENKSAQKFVLWSPHEKWHYTFKGEPAFAADKFPGLTASLPPMSAQVLVIEPFDALSDYGRAVSAEDTRTRSEGMIDVENRKFSERLSEIESLMTPVLTENHIDFGNIPSLTYGNVRLGMSASNASDIYEIHTPRQNLRMDLRHGVIVRNWLIDHQPMVFDESAGGMMSQIRFYFPIGYVGVDQMPMAYRFVSQGFDEADSAVHVAFESTIEHGELLGAKVTKTFVIPVEDVGYQLKIRIDAPEDRDLTLGLWIKDVPRFLAGIDDARPRIESGGQWKEDWFGRPALFLAKDNDEYNVYIDIIRNMVQPQKIDNVSEGRLCLEGKPLSLSIESNQAIAFYLWSSMRSSLVTFETLFEPVAINKGESHTFKIQYGISDVRKASSTLPARQ